MNIQLFGSLKHSRTCSHLKDEFDIPECVSRIRAMVCTFSLTDSHFASTGVLGSQMIKGTATAKVRTTQIRCSHFHEEMPPTSPPALSSLMSL